MLCAGQFEWCFSDVALLTFLSSVLRCVSSKLDRVITWLRQLESHQRLKQALYLQVRAIEVNAF